MLKDVVEHDMIPEHLSILLYPLLNEKLTLLHTVDTNKYNLSVRS